MNTTSPAKYGLTAAHIETLRGILAPFAAQITRAAIFGSRATGTSRPGSDIDLVLYGDMTDSDLSQIRLRCSESMLPHTVDVLAYHLIASAALIERIDQEAQILFTKENLSS